MKLGYSTVQYSKLFPQRKIAGPFPMLRSRYVPLPEAPRPPRKKKGGAASLSTLRSVYSTGTTDAP